MRHNRALPMSNDATDWSVKLLALVALTACVPTSRAESEPVAADLPSVTAPAREPEAGLEPDASGPEQQLHASEPVTETEPVIADSNIVTDFIVDADAQPGLIEFTNGLPREGSLWVGQLEGNGGRDVLVYIPPGARNDAEFQLVFHFHGTYSERFQKPSEGLDKQQWVGWDRLAQTIEAVRELQGAREHNVALIYPFSAGKRLEPEHKGWSNDKYDRMWMLPASDASGTIRQDYRDSFDKLHEEVVALLRDELGVHPSKLTGKVLAEGHSAGGIALRNIAVAGTAHVDEYLFLDASFQGWADGCWAALQAVRSAATVTIVLTDKGIADPHDGRDPWCVDLQRDAALWTEKSSWCEDKPERKPGRSEWTCTELGERATEWKDYEAWCRAMENDMQNVPGVTLVRTKVVHGEQPRRFAGGLGLTPSAPLAEAGIEGAPPNDPG